MADSGVRRSCESDVRRAARSLSVSAVRLALSTSSARCTRSMAKRGLVDQRVEQPPLVRRQQWTRLIAVDANDADGRPAGSHGKKQPFAPGTCRPPPRGTIVAASPFGRRHVRIGQDVFRRIARLHGGSASSGNSSTTRSLSMDGDLKGGGPQQVVERTDAGELATKGIKRLGRLGALRQRQPDSRMRAARLVAMTARP